MQLVLHVKDAKGERDIEFEGHSTNNMYRAGYRDNMIKVGDTITVYIAPLKDGSDGGYVTAALTASGTRFGMRSRAELEQERLKAEGQEVKSERTKVERLSISALLNTENMSL